MDDRLNIYPFNICNGVQVHINVAVKVNLLTITGQWRIQRGNSYGISLHETDFNGVA